VTRNGPHPRPVTCLGCGHHFPDAEYVEPYAGGASVALSLLFEDYASHVHINDINVSVHAFWQAVLEQTDDLCALIADTEISIDEWRRQRDVQAQAADADPLALAFSTFVLNRTNRSGIIGGGIIGGQDQTGPWKLDARYNRPELVRRIRKVARFRDRITLTRRDAVEQLAEWTDETRRAVIYLDPPYYRKGDSLYEDFYSHHHHVEVARIVKRLKAWWLVSYDAARPIFEMYSKVRSIRYELGHTAREAYQGFEVMFFSPDLIIPNTPSPAGISMDDVLRSRQRSFAV
jgi:DNA adenine methylase